MKLSLHNRQNMVLQAINNGVSEILFGGAAGGGKSYLLRAIACIFAIQCPGISIYLFRRKVKDLKATHLRGAMSFPIMLKDFINDKLVNINKANNIIEFENDSTITLAHINYESDLDDYLSAEIHIGLFDEATTFLPVMIRFIRSRVRLGSLDIPSNLQGVLPFIIYSTNPRGPSHHLFKSGWVDAAKPMTKFTAPKSEGSMTRIFIPAFLSDNPSLTTNDPKYAERLLGLGNDDIIKAYLDGDWTTVEGAALPKLNRKHHFIRERKIPKNWIIKRAYDYGFSAPYSVLFYTIATGETNISPDSEDYFNPIKGSIIIVGEIYGDDGNEGGLKEETSVTSKKIEMFEIEHGWSVRPGPADTSIFDKEQGPSIASLMNVKWTRSNKTPGSRINGLALCRQMILNSMARTPEKPGLYIFDNCNRLFKHLSDLQTDGEDVDTSGQPDHDWDVLRYIVLDVVKEIKTIKVVGA
jgi:hypothetical protein